MCFHVGGNSQQGVPGGGGVGIEHMVHKPPLSLHQISFGTRSLLKKLEEKHEIN